MYGSHVIKDNNYFELFISNRLDLLCVIIERSAQINMCTYQDVGLSSSSSLLSLSGDATKITSLLVERTDRSVPPGFAYWLTYFSRF